MGASGLQQGGEAPRADRAARSAPRPAERLRRRRAPLGRARRGCAQLEAQEDRRRPEDPQHGVNSQRAGGRTKVPHRSDCLADDQRAAPRPPEGGLAPSRHARDADRLERRAGHLRAGRRCAARPDEPRSMRSRGGATRGGAALRGARQASERARRAPRSRPGRRATRPHRRRERARRGPSRPARARSSRNHRRSRRRRSGPLSLVECAGPTSNGPATSLVIQPP